MTPKTLTRLVFVLLTPLLVTCSSGSLGFFFYPNKDQRTQLAGVRAGVTPFNPVRAGLDPRFEVVGYLPSYQIKNLDVRITENLTDLIYFSIPVNSDGSLPVKAPKIDHRDFLQEARDRYGVRIIQGLADHRGSSERSEGFAAITSDKKARQAFVANLTEYLVINGFDGADIDWEYPRSWREKENFTILLQELKAAFAPYNMKLSIAISPNLQLSQACYEAVDRVHVMTYDDVGKHSTLSGSSRHIRHLISAGVPTDKLMMGVPFYGRGFYMGRSWSSALTYKSIQERFGPGAQQDLIGGYYFNGIETMQDKVKFARRQNIAGIMVWEIGQDTNDETSLLRAITAVQRQFAPKLVQLFP